MEINMSEPAVEAKVSKEIPEFVVVQHADASGAAQADIGKTKEDEFMVILDDIVERKISRGFFRTTFQGYRMTLTSQQRLILEPSQQSK